MKGKRADIEELFRLYYRPLCLYASKFLPDPQSVEDVVQESFISYWNRLQDGTIPSSPKSYLYRTVHNRCIDELRGRADEGIPEGIAYDIVDEQASDRSFIWARLWTAIDKLPEKRREILLMNKRDGMTYSQIASKLGISEHTVHAQITRALRTLREGAKKIFLYFFV
ncbi:MAG: sigma-70 family RNA polymerase sigma factor [Bacteroidia bacterium]|nr:sigma-70 family RNA polymerase sigma factor [Bacteroidia bacterium]